MLFQTAKVVRLPSEPFSGDSKVLASVVFTDRAQGMRQLKKNDTFSRGVVVQATLPLALSSTA